MPSLHRVSRYPKQLVWLYRQGLARGWTAVCSLQMFSYFNLIFRIKGLVNSKVVRLQLTQERLLKCLPLNRPA